VVLVLVGVPASALVAVSLFHLSSATRSSVVSRDLRTSDLDADGSDEGRLRSSRIARSAWGCWTSPASLCADDRRLRI